MRWCYAIILPAIFLLQACDSKRPVVSDDLVRQFREEFPGITEKCLDMVRYGGVNAMPTRADQCFEMTPMKRWKGLWRNEFEGSRFCASPAKSCSFETPGERVWLSDPDNIVGTKISEEGLYEIEFLGRRTIKRGAHGHLGGSDHEVVVNKIVSISRVDPE